MIDRHNLTEVPPPLPEEPLPWAVVADTHGNAWQRLESGLWYPVKRGFACCTWEELHRRWGPLHRLIPDPSDDAPELPLELHDPNLGKLISVSMSGDGALICMPAGGTRFDAGELDKIAAAVARAARDARRSQNNTQEGS